MKKSLSAWALALGFAPNIKLILLPSVMNPVHLVPIALSFFLYPKISQAYRPLILFLILLLCGGLITSLVNQYSPNLTYFLAYASGPVLMYYLWTTDFKDVNRIVSLFFYLLFYCSAIQYAFETTIVHETIGRILTIGIAQWNLGMASNVRGVPGIYPEPSIAAAYFFLFAFLKYRYGDNKRWYALPIYSVLFLLFNKSATLILYPLIFLVPFLFKMRVRMLPYLLSGSLGIFLLSQVEIFSSSRAFSLATQIVELAPSMFERGKLLETLSLISSRRLIEVIAAYHFFLQNPLGSGLGAVATNFYDHMVSSGYALLISEYTYPQFQQMLTSGMMTIKPFSYMTQALYDLGFFMISALAVLFAPVFRAFLGLEVNRVDLCAIALAVFIIFFFGVLTTTVSWILLGSTFIWDPEKNRLKSRFNDLMIIPNTPR